MEKAGVFQCLERLHMLCRDFEEVAQHRVELDADGRNAGVLLIFCFKPCNDFPAVIA